MARAGALGVPAGPLYCALQKGSDVAIDDGRVVRSADVVGHSIWSAAAAPPQRRHGRRTPERLTHVSPRYTDAARELAADFVEIDVPR